MKSEEEEGMETELTEMQAAAVAREKTIVKVSLISILTNFLLAGFKAAVGIVSNSIAVVLDAVNNLTDGLSSVVTIIGAKLGSKPPDKKHPLGYGRIEYLSSMIVAALVLYAGITSMVESVKKIINPTLADYSKTSIIIISVALVVKFILGVYVRGQGHKVNSKALVASGVDSMSDSILSASVLASAIVYLIWDISLEAYVGAVISVFIIKAGLEMMLETMNDVIGHRENKEVSQKIKSILDKEPEVRGAYDLVLFNYGPNRFYGSVHLELPDAMTVEKVDELTRRVQLKVYEETGVILTGVGVYSFNTKNNKAAEIRNTIQKTILSHEWALQLHGFYVDMEKKAIRFDVVLSFDIDREEALAIMQKEVQDLYPEYAIEILPDVDFSD
jgi:cation diffusion facilitator family transporter